MAIVTEVWRSIPGFPFYEASSQGRVRSIDRIVPHWRGGVRKMRGVVLKGAPHRGYLVVGLHENGKVTVFGAHQAVAMAWYGIPRDGLVVNHINGNKQDNRPENLEYITNRGNVLHAYENGFLDNSGESNGNARLSDTQVEEIRQKAARCSYSELSKTYGVTATHIRRLVRLEQRAATPSGE